MFRALLAVALLSAAVVSATEMKASSRIGQKLISKSRRLNDERDISWMPNYSIKFQKCHSLLQVAGGEGGGGGGEGENQLYTQHLVEFALCPSDSCTTGHGCKYGAQYIVNMREFVQLYTELKEEEKEAACEAIAENCNCENANDDEACENQCYIDADMEVCIEVEGEEEEDMERYLECEALELDENNGNYNYNYNNNANYYREYFVGPYCSANGKAIHLGVFVDQACSVKAESGVYEEFHYGKSLPYSSTSMVEMDCISCREPEEDDGNNNNNNNNNNSNNNNGKRRTSNASQ
uniref:Subtilisin n=1 Tax=Cyclophora tenuis TaxID=216820 RepID=A0A7S1D426_CYCTE|mmetsp:Transcript_18475/g.31565  ORF Transcript_18475/g.31565 Transcript_18475/m.31565 type:complete len:294 (+) Transcript_18475:18-899(+)